MESFTDSTLILRGWFGHLNSGFRWKARAFWYWEQAALPARRCLVLKERGAEIFILNRNLAAAQKLARQAKARTVKRTDLKKLDFDVIINATPVGMGNTRDSPLNPEEIRAKLVFDMVYDPAETRLLKLAKERGAEVIPGSVMFVHQAARQFEIWTGKPAPREDMLRIVTVALAERAAARNGSKRKTSSVAVPTYSKNLRSAFLPSSVKTLSG